MRNFNFVTYVASSLTDLIQLFKVMIHRTDGFNYTINLSYGRIEQFSYTIWLNVCQFKTVTL